jgi:arylsulfatase A-like enzyme
MKGEYGEDVFVSFIARFMEQHKQDPFFVYYPMALTHAPFEPTPNSPEWRSGDRHKADPKFFRDMVEYMDASVGRLVEHIDRLGLHDNTMILFFSDNGSPREIASRMGDRVIQGGKGATTDAGTHVPMIAHWRSVTPAGKVLDDLIDSTDFIPTMLEAARAKLPSGFVADGRSFLPQLRGEKGRPRELIYSWYDPRPGWDKDRFSLKIFARDKRYKLYSSGEMFDVPADPLEQTPIPPEREAAAIRRARKRLRETIDRMASQTTRQH